MAKEKKEKKPVTRGSAIRLTTILTIVAVICLGVMIALPIVLNYYDGVMRDFFGEASSSGVSADVDFEVQNYNDPDYDSYEILEEKEKEYVRKGGAESVVLLKNDGVLPLATSSSNKTKIAFFSQSSVDIIVGGSGSGESSSDVTLKEAFESEDYEVNESLWNYYANTSRHGRGDAASFSGSGDWAIDEVPISELQSGVTNFNSISQDSTAIFIMSRTGGEGADEPRYMGSSGATTPDQSLSYLEPDSVELGVIDYLNQYFSDVILVLNTNNVMETGWIDNYANIKAVLWAPGAGDQTAYALADVIKGNVSPSGRLVDTMAYSDFSSPAMQNMGDFRYTNGGSDTNYYGVSYDEGIYVGYKYYETRYYDAVMGQGNATGSAGVYCSSGSSWNYAEEVAYPFGYGESYTTFEWSDFEVTENEEDDTFTVSVNVKNTGSATGKDVVEVYLNAPYTDYDKTNHIEKSAVTLVGFEKTKTLDSGDDQTVEIVVDKSDLCSYDDVGYKTYVLEAGDYLLTAAADAHAAANNFLAYEGKSVGTGSVMTEDGDTDFVGVYTQGSTDAKTYAVSATGAEVTNRFESAAASTATTVTSNCNYIARSAYLTRNDWQGSWPATHGSQDDKASSSFDELNGYQYKEEISSTLLAKLQERGTASAANSPIDDSSITSEMAGSYGVEGDFELINYRGLDYGDGLDDADVDWLGLVSQMTTSEMGKIVNLSGYNTAAADSIMKPKAVDKDGPAGLTNMVGSGGESIAFLTDVAVATTWNEDVSYYHGYFIGQDGLTFDDKVNGWYGPAMNIHRTPFAGRNFEYYSEDGYLSGVMASKAVRGAADNGMYSFIKHYALNEQETHRDANGIASWCNEQAMREIYLRPFQMVSEAGTVTERYYELDEDGFFKNADTIINEDGEEETVVELSEIEVPAMQGVMTSFNRVGATWAGGSYQLLQEILREEWGFNGFVITDYSGPAYMDTNQMLRAGGDAQLTQFGSNYKTSSDADIYYSKVAMSHVLYTVTNSNAMNGYVSGAVNGATPFAYYYLVEIALEIIFAAGLVLCIVFTVRKWMRYRSDKNGGDNNPDDSYDEYGTSDELSL